MPEKGSANIKSRDTANNPQTRSITTRYGANKEFNQWWEHWMSKVPNARLSGNKTLAKDTPDDAGYPSELDGPVTRKDAA